MAIVASGFCHYEAFSPNYFDFKPNHFNYSKLEEVTYNPQLTDDFEWFILHQYTNGNRNQDRLPAELSDGVSNILQWIITECAPGGKITLSHEETLQEITIAFSDYRFELGNIRADSTRKNIPEFVAITDRVTENKVTLWLQAASFEINYPYGDAEIFFLTENIDDMLSQTLGGMKLLLGNLETMPFQTDIANQTMVRNATAVKMLDTQWVNYNNAAESIRIPFGLAIYGNRYNDNSGMTTAVRDFIVDSTQESTTKWETVLPELFNVVTFLIVPSWDKVASGVEPNPRYSPIIKTIEVANFIKNRIDGYNGAHVDNHLETLPTAYQSLMTHSIAADTNADDRLSLTELYKDYITAGPSSNDFIHMRNETQAFVQRLLDGLVIAEGYPTVATTPGFNAEVIANNTYITFLNGVGRYRILTKLSHANVPTA